MATFRGEKSDAVIARYGVVVSRYNEELTTRLLDGAVQTLRAAGIAEEAIDVAWVPGAFEVPLAAEQMATSGRYDAVLCLGAVIRGETTHDQHINRSVSLGIMEVGLRHSLPVLFGILTCDTFEQAIQRAGGNVGQKDAAGGSKAAATPAGGKKPVANKGAECAEAALEMVGLLKKLKALDE